MEERYEIMVVQESDEHGVSVVIYDYGWADLFDDYLTECVFAPYTVEIPKEYIPGQCGMGFYFGVLADKEKVYKLLNEFKEYEKKHHE